MARPRIFRLGLGTPGAVRPSCTRAVLADARAGKQMASAWRHELRCERLEAGGVWQLKGGASSGDGYEATR